MRKRMCDNIILLIIVFEFMLYSTGTFSLCPPISNVYGPVEEGCSETLNNSVNYILPLDTNYITYLVGPSSVVGRSDSRRVYTYNFIMATVFISVLLLIFISRHYLFHKKSDFNCCIAIIMDYIHNSDGKSRSVS